MTKQEEVEEGIAQSIRLGICAYQHLGFDNPEMYREIGKKVVAKLHSQRVVIEVDRELPSMPPATDEELKARASGKCQFIRHGQYINTWHCGLTGETTRQMKFCKKWSGNCNPEDCIAEFKAGYVAVMPLIKEV